MMFIILFLSCVFCVEYTLSTDKKTFTAFVSVEGNLEPLTSDIVQKSKVHTNYETAIIKSGISSIDTGAFSGCLKLKNVDIAETVVSIGNQAFASCSSLTEIVFPTGTKNFGNEILKGCSKLKKVTFPSTMEKVGTKMFTTTALNEIIVLYNPKFTTNTENSLLIQDKTIIKAFAMGLNSVIIPKEITNIWDYSFSFASSLKSISFEKESNLSIISSYSFYQSGVTQIEIPEGTKQIAANAFGQMYSLTSIFFPSSLESVDPTCISKAKALTSVTVGKDCKALYIDSSDVVYISSDNSILFMPIDIKSFHIKNATRDVTQQLLQSRKQLVSITTDKYHPAFLVDNNTLYNAVTKELIAAVGGAKIVKVYSKCTSIGLSAFNTVDIETVDMAGTNVKIIDSGAFAYTYSLKSITFSDKLDRIYGNAFSYSNLRQIIFPASLKTLDKELVSSSNVTSIDLSKCTKLTKIPESSFIKAYKLNSVKFPTIEMDITIESFAFQNCQSLKKITIEPSIVSIKDSSFSGSGITTIEFKTNCRLSSIGSYAFSKCPIASITFPDVLGAIDSYAFSGCSSLTSVTFGENSELKSVSPFIFNGCKLKSVKFGNKLSSVMECAFSGCDTLEKIELFEGNNNLNTSKGCLYSFNLSTFIACPPGLKTMELDEKTKSIASSAFFECKKLNTVTFHPNSEIIEIGPATFYGCVSLSHLTLPKNIIKVSTECFSKCESLSSVTFPSGCKITIIEERAFSGSGLLSIDLRQCSSLETLSSSAFEGCASLDTVFLPPALKTVEPNCFVDCPKLLNVEYCPVSLTPPSVSDNVFDGCGNLKGVIVPIEYPESEFGGVITNRILDGDCYRPTAMFTAHTNSYFPPVLFMNGEDCSE